MKKPAISEPAFVMGAGDRFHSIIVTDGIRFATEPDVEIILTFFAIRRASGLIDVVNVNKTFRGSECIKRNIQKKSGIPAGNIQAELGAIRKGFGGDIEAQTGQRLEWHILDLSGVEDSTEQVRLIRSWGRVGVKLGLDLPPLRMN
jgi:hypothetical protein